MDKTEKLLKKGFSADKVSQILIYTGAAVTADAIELAVKKKELTSFTWTGWGSLLQGLILADRKTLQPYSATRQELMMTGKGFFL